MILCCNKKEENNVMTELSVHFFEKCKTYLLLQKQLGENSCKLFAKQFSVPRADVHKVYELVENIKSYLTPYVYNIRTRNNMKRLVTSYLTSEYKCSEGEENVLSKLTLNQLLTLIGEPITFDVDESYLPIHYPHSNKSWLTQVANRWGSGEQADLSNDKNDFETLSEDQKKFLLFTLAFFAKSDISVLEFLNARYLSEIKALHIRMALSEQAGAECTHILSYAYQIDSLVEDEKQKAELFAAVDKYPIVQRKIEWVKSYVNDPHMGIAVVCLIQMCMEAIYFSSSFASIFWFRQQGLFEGVAELNKYIVRDEFKHCEEFANIYKVCIAKPPRELIVALFSKAVEIESESVDLALPNDLFGMNKNLMKQHVKAVCDTALSLIDEAPIYEVSTPFEWYKSFDSVEVVVNFFERKVTDYNERPFADFET